MVVVTVGAVYERVAMIIQKRIMTGCLYCLDSGVGAVTDPERPWRIAGEALANT